LRLMFMKILGHKRVKISGQFRALHSEELYDLYRFPSIVSSEIKSMLAWTCSLY
jgi:hypothetical protein